MIALMKFFYRREYFSKDDFPSPLGFLAAVYQVADKYLVPQLKKDSLQRFRSMLNENWDSDDFLSVIPLVYESIPKSDRGLRDLVVDAADPYLEELTTKQAF
ncbi:hypothetical protein N7481_012895 [Penicillium waksmanii]|uniref:uncharacterized protein n=1 Tax=Penicillium waksmanii TaxID=69791 RepID=UPI002546D5FC|nr:uncharacterized protein N7481_012895 [Penicillium waksmanii]KAJ5966181.1 hypothetical protein N7481_012895 [Penicillium waksmanii]